MRIGRCGTAAGREVRRRTRLEPEKGMGLLCLDPDCRQLRRKDRTRRQRLLRGAVRRPGGHRRQSGHRLYDRRWLADGGRIRVEKAPTAFGEVSFVIESALKRGYVDADVTLPDRNPPSKALMRLRLPGGARIISAKANGVELKMIDGETIDLTGLRGHLTIKARVAK